MIEDPKLAQELSNLMEQKTSEAAAKATAIIAPVLKGSLGFPESLAVVLGALLVKKLVKGTSDFICTSWQKTSKHKMPNPSPYAIEIGRF